MATTKSNNASSMWDYEAPQYCDFSSAETFAENDPNVDKFFLTDHDATKENIGEDELFNESSETGSDSDVYTTPMTMRNGKHGGSAFTTPTSEFVTPKLASKSDAAATPVNPRLSTLRQTPLRDIYNQGGTPLHEVGHGLKVFKSGGSRKSRKQSLMSGEIIKSAAKKAASATVTKKTSSRRETFDMAPISDALECIESTESTIEKAATPPKTEMAESAISNSGPHSELLSEDENDDTEEKHEQTILELKTKEEKTDVQAESTIDFHNITDQELTESAIAPPPPSTTSPNTSRRSSYIVKSPSIRVVHFAEDTINKSSQQLDAIGEDHVSPVGRASSKSAMKIKARVPTPMVKPDVTTGTRKSTSLLGTLRNRLSKKYIKRFSKTLEEEASAGPSTSTAGPGPSNAATGSKPGAKPAGLPKKRVTIAVAPKTASNSTTNASNATAKGKRNMSLKGSGRFTSAANVLARSKSTTAAGGTSSVASKESTTAFKHSPYIGLTVYNQKFMNSCRSYSPLTPLSSKPKVTIPRSPNLLTSVRSTIRKYHTMPELKAPAAPAVPARKQSVAPAPQPKPSTSKPFVPTKAITPKFSTDSRLKMWHLKHDETSAAAGDRTDAVGSKTTRTTTFKARPVPNFKRLQALSEKRKAEAIAKYKDASARPNKLAPFSFDGRATGKGPGKA